MSFVMTVLTFRLMLMHFESVSAALGLLACCPSRVGVGSKEAVNPCLEPRPAYHHFGVLSFVMILAAYTAIA